MAGATELLSVALDGSGVICIFVQKGDKQWNKFFPAGAYQQAANWAAQKDKEGFDCYFCTASLATQENRKSENAHAVKLVKLDLDIDASSPKKFATRDEAIKALREFAKLVGMPKPTIVSSGGGFHVYWFMEEALSVIDGKDIQERFKALTIHHGLKADATITADIVRVLRLPGTHNHKDATNPREVVFMTPLVVYDTDELCEIIDRAYAKLPNAMPPAAAPLFAGQDISHLQSEDAATQKLAGDANKVLVFSKLLRVSLEGGGCAQIARMWNNREHASEPEWRDLLSFAAKAADRDKAIHDVSELHESYSPSATEQKANSIPAPHNCAYFQSGEHGATCKGCKHAKKINSPVSLGMVTQKAVGDDNIIVTQNVNVDEAPRQYVIPPLPPGYFRGKHGGIYKQAKSDTEEDTKLCHEDFYAVSNLKDGDNYLIELCVNTGKHDGLKQFMLPMAGLYGDTTKKVLPEKGVRPPYAALGFMPLVQYVSDFHLFLREQKASASVKHQFGWTSEEFKSFVIGEREIIRRDNGSVDVVYSQPSDELLSICDRFSRRGSLEAWKKAVSVYDQHEGMAPHRFGVLLGFAGPLVSLLGLKGMVVNLFGAGSGHGKSTVLKSQATIWGSPAAMRPFTDTHASRLHTIGCYKNIPAMIDEMTDVPTEQIQDFLYQITTGQGKDRMEAQTNKLRANNTTWATVVSITANTSFADRITSAQAGGEGVLMRLLEVHFGEQNRNLLSKSEAEEVFGALDYNYGHAGEAFIKHVLAKGIDNVRDMLQDARRAIDRDSGMETRNQERFWSAAVATAYVGGLLAVEAGLLDFDMEKMRAWIIQLVHHLRTNQLAHSKDDNKQIVSDFVNQNLHAMFMYNYTGEDESTAALANRPNTKAVGRINTHKNGMVEAFLLRTAFNEHLSKTHKLSISEFLKDMVAAGMPMTEVRGRLALGAAEGADKDDKSLIASTRVYRVVLVEAKEDGNGTTKH